MTCCRPVRTGYLNAVWFHIRSYRLSALERAERVLGPVPELLTDCKWLCGCKALTGERRLLSTPCSLMHVAVAKPVRSPLLPRP